MANTNNRNWNNNQQQPQQQQAASPFGEPANNPQWQVPTASDLDDLRAKIAAMPYNNPNFWSTKR